MSRKTNSRIEKTQDEYQSYFKQKADILLLKRPATNVKWPVRAYRQVYENDAYNKKVKERNIYTSTAEKAIAKVSVTKQRHFKRTAWDPVMYTKLDLQHRRTKKSELDLSIEEGLIDFVETTKTPFDDLKEPNTMDDQHTELIKDLSLQLLDNVINNIANPNDKDKYLQKKELDWEFMLANALQTGLPTVVIDRVKRHMALVTGKKTPAITGLNVTPCQLSDLTISDTEMEMKAAVQEMHQQTENESFEPTPDNDFGQDLKWLIDLSRKQASDQLAEIDQINTQYSNRVLNLRPAFF